VYHSVYHRLNINRPTKHGKEKSPSDGHKRDGRPFTDVSTIFDREPHSAVLLISEHYF
jgi:hypothetical protein